MSIYEKLSKVNVNDKTEKKGKFTYLSWAFAWGELKKVAPNAKATVYHDKFTDLPYYTSSAGVIVKVGITIEDVEHISYLPVMDFKNNAVPADQVDMMGVNKAIQRATVKAIGLHGLGLYIYAGEDLPEESDGKALKTTTLSKTKTASKSTTQARPSFRKPAATTAPAIENYSSGDDI